MVLKKTQLLTYLLIYAFKPDVNVNFSSLHPFSALCAFWFQEKIALHKIHVTGTVLMTQLLTKSPTSAYLLLKTM